MLRQESGPVATIRELPVVVLGIIEWYVEIVAFEQANFEVRAIGVSQSRVEAEVDSIRLCVIPAKKEVPPRRNRPGSDVLSNSP